MYIVIIMLALHLKKVASIIRWKTQVWYTHRNISWSCCHHKSRPWSPFICVNISGKYDEGDHNSNKGMTDLVNKLQTVIICVERDITRYCGEFQVATLL